MLHLALLYFIGKKFFELAEEYDKSKWGYAIAGVVSYYAGAFIFGAILGVIVVLLESDFLETTNDFVLGIIALPFGLLSCYLLYTFLEKKWKTEKPDQDTMIDQIGNS